MVFKLEDSCSLEQNSDKLLIRGMEPAEQSKPSETLLPANYHCHWFASCLSYNLQIGPIAVDQRKVYIHIINFIGTCTS